MKVEPSSQPSPAAAPFAPAAGARAAAPSGFGQALAQARTAASERVVMRGDTLVGVVREQAAQRGVQLSASQAWVQARQVAKDSAIANPDRIFPGQKLALEGLNSRLAGLPATSAQAAEPAAQVLGRSASALTLAQTSAASTAQMPQGQAPQGQVRAPADAAVIARAARQPPAAYNPAAADRAQGGLRKVAASASELADSARIGPSAGPHPVLEQTLDRAVSRGFIPAIERGDVYDKILELAARHRFQPDDFARMTLMESDGLNPRATNERCHGIIQFCDGNDRGAATAGFAANPRAILGLSVYQQLHLVDKYFTEVGVKSSGSAPARLDDLYLSVLMPAARSNTDPNAPLGIAGPQARYLHVGRDRSAPITRQSILDGLQQNANERLASYAQRMQAQAMREEPPAYLGGTRLR